VQQSLLQGEVSRPASEFCVQSDRRPLVIHVLVRGRGNSHQLSADARHVIDGASNCIVRACALIPTLQEFLFFVL
jgi:hypothetical protein